MYLVYADESKDQARNLGVFCWVLVTDSSWIQAFSRLREFRRKLRDKHGIFTGKELHARQFVSGRGKYSAQSQSIEERREIYLQSLKWFADYVPVSLVFGKFSLKHEMRVFERTINRLNRTMEARTSRALIFWDEGKEAAYTRMCRKLRVHCYIPSKYGTWENGQQAKNIPATSILEYPVFKHSEDSPFIQMADFCAYALLRREAPITSKRLGGLSGAFKLLQPLTIPEVFSKNNEGIITDE